MALQLYMNPEELETKLSQLQSGVDTFNTDISNFSKSFEDNFSDTLQGATAAAFEALNNKIASVATALNTTVAGGKAAAAKDKADYLQRDSDTSSQNVKATEDATEAGSSTKGKWQGAQ